MILATLQRDFQAWLVEASEDAADRLSVHAATGLAVYQNNYRVQLVTCLENTFPHLRTWLGEDEFRNTAIAHIDHCPPYAWTLDAYSEHFGETLLKRFPHNPDIHELAWIEQALGEAFIAADADPLAPDALASIDWDNARLHFTPSLRLHELTTNVEAIWSALCEDQPAPESEMLAIPGGLLVWRRGFTSRLRDVDGLEYAALLHLQQDPSFVGLCEMLVEQLGESEGVAKAGELLANWLGSELITGVDSDTQSEEHL
ncbi:putative DNA-binding domain-containing protein [Pseudomonas sp. NPDC090202]|uniref:HvfC/BufC family peptide modification chaperone n=1 Tax=unclassified Pseudomonas TaxID=196821 RepID=UPI0037F56A8F